MTGKQPTPQGISALLRKAGFQRAVVTRRGRHHPQHTEGFHVKAFMGTVRVNWWPESGRDLAEQHAEDTVRRREILGCYAADLRDAGYAVEEKAGSLIVTAPESTETEKP